VPVGLAERPSRSNERAVSYNAFNFKTGEPEWNPIFNWKMIYRKAKDYLMKRDGKTCKFRPGYQDNSFSKCPYKPIRLDSRYGRKTNVSKGFMSVLQYFPQIPLSVLVLTAWHYHSTFQFKRRPSKQRQDSKVFSWARYAFCRFIGTISKQSEAKGSLDLNATLHHKQSNIAGIDSMEPEYTPTGGKLNG